MRSVVQRVSRARIAVGGEVVAEIGEGMLALVAAGRGDDASKAQALVKKLVHLRIFADESGRMNRSLIDVGGSLCVVSQFTLYADTSRGRRPWFGEAAPPDQAEALIDAVVTGARAAGVTVVTGRFGVEMEVELVNAGPVTIWIDEEADALSRGSGAAGNSA